MPANRKRLRTVVDELNRRKVVRTAIAYGVAAGAVMQIASVVIPALYLPGELLTVVVVLGVAGLPVAVALSWLFEVTPERARARASLADPDTLVPAADNGALPRGMAVASAPSAPPAAAAALSSGVPPAGSQSANPGGALVHLPDREGWHPRAAGSIPGSATPFIGRQEELAALVAMLSDDRTRLVTLTGPGGVGKTRLAGEAAEALRTEFADGVRWLAVSPLNSAERLPAALAMACGIDPSRGADPLGEVVDYLRNRQMLLVLDNFEHLASGAALLAGLLEEARGVRLLVTSRQRLQLQAETLLVLDGLDFAAERPGSSDAVRLFLTTAARLDRGFSPTEGDSDAIRQICALLGGIPLAIELAASWTRVMSCAEILVELRQGLDLLSAGAPDLPERHRSMRATFLASWRMLRTEEQSALARLSVMRTPFHRAAAAAVASADAQLLMGLLDKSLLSGTGGQFTMPDVIRQFAREMLAADPTAAEAACHAHAQHFADVLMQLAPGVARSEPASLSQAQSIIDELHAAWHYATAGRNLKLMGELAAPLFDYHDARGLAREGVALFELGAVAVAAAVPAASEGQEHLVGMIDVRLGAFCNMLDRRADAERLLRQGLLRLRRSGEPSEVAFALQRLGANLLVTGDYEGAAAAHDEARQLAIAAGDDLRLGRSLSQLGNVAWSRGDLERAGAFCTEGLQLAREQEDRHGMLIALNTLGVIAAGRAAYGEAREWFREALAIQQELGDRRSAAALLHNLGNVALLAGDRSEARAYLLQGLEISEAMGYQGWLALSLSGLAALCLADDDLDAATGMLRRAVATAVASANAPILLKALDTAARLQRSRGDTTGAVDTARVVLAHPASDQESRASARTLLTQMNARLEPAADVEAELTRITAALLDTTGVTSPSNREVTVNHRRRAGLSALLLLVSIPLGCATAGRGVDISTLRQLTCADTPQSVPQERSIGRWGGVLRAGPHEVLIPARAVQGQQAFRLEPMAGPAVGVNFRGGTGSFAREVTVAISMEHCTAAELAVASSPAAFAIYRQTGATWQRLDSTVDGRRVLAETRRNSGFIIIAE
jgi:predicted ATPase